MPSNTLRSPVASPASVRLLTAAFAFGAFLSSCSNGDAYSELKPLLCNQEDVGQDYQQLTDGDFSVRDLADLGPNASLRERELREAGVQHGGFILFKQSLPKPPFDPPVNVVCQALQFDSPEHARAFVRDLRPNDSLATTAMVWIPEGARDFATVNAAESPAPRGETWARFVIRAGTGEETMNAVYDATSSGSTVLTIVVGEADSTQSAEQRDRLAAVLTARSLRLIPPRP